METKCKICNGICREFDREEYIETDFDGEKYEDYKSVFVRYKCENCENIEEFVYAVDLYI